MISIRISAAVALAVVTACSSAPDDTSATISPSDSPVAADIAANELRADVGVTDAVFAIEPDVQASLAAAVTQYAPSPPFALSGLTVNTTSGAIAGVASSQGDPYEFVDQQRTSGSTLKVAVLAAAFAAGAQPTDRIAAGINCAFPNGRIARIDQSVGVAPTLSDAADVSSDCGFVKLTRIVGEERLAETLRTFGIDRRFDLGADFAVGANTVSARELAQVLASIINVRVTPIHLVVGTRDPNGHPELFTEPLAGAVDPHVSAGTLESLEGVLSTGTAAGAQLAGHPAAGKTGTSADSTDVWFVGGTMHYVTVMWAGHPTEHELSLNGQVESVPGAVTGGNYTAQAWRAAMQPIHDQLPATPFIQQEWTREPVLLIDQPVDCPADARTPITPDISEPSLPHIEITSQGIAC